MGEHERKYQCRRCGARAAARRDKRMTARAYGFCPDCNTGGDAREYHARLEEGRLRREAFFRERDALWAAGVKLQVPTLDPESRTAPGQGVDPGARRR